MKTNTFYALLWKSQGAFVSRINGMSPVAQDCFEYNSEISAAQRFASARDAMQTILSATYSSGTRNSGYNSGLVVVRVTETAGDCKPAKEIRKVILESAILSFGKAEEVKWAVKFDMDHTFGSYSSYFVNAAGNNGFADLTLAGLLDSAGDASQIAVRTSIKLDYAKHIRIVPVLVTKVPEKSMPATFAVMELV